MLTSIPPQDIFSIRRNWCQHNLVREQKGHPAESWWWHTHIIMWTQKKRGIQLGSTKFSFDYSTVQIPRQIRFKTKRVPLFFRAEFIINKPCSLIYFPYPSSVVNISFSVRYDTSVSSGNDDGSDLAFIIIEDRHREFYAEGDVLSISHSDTTSLDRSVRSGRFAISQNA